MSVIFSLLCFTFQSGSKEDPLWQVTQNNGCPPSACAIGTTARFIQALEHTLLLQYNRLCSSHTHSHVLLASYIRITERPLFSLTCILNNTIKCLAKRASFSTQVLYLNFISHIYFDSLWSDIEKIRNKVKIKIKMDLIMNLRKEICQ